MEQKMARVSPKLITCELEKAVVEIKIPQIAFETLCDLSWLYAEYHQCWALIAHSFVTLMTTKQSLM